MMHYEELTTAGIDMDDLLRRLMGNAALIKIFVNKFMSDRTYEELVTALNEKDMKKAEIASHTLKGMCGNMSLTVLYRLFTEQVNLLRIGEYEKAEAMMSDIAGSYENAVSHMKLWLQNQS